ncbi:MAG: response regulator [Desulfobacterales bacterium]|nr:response regulator [Desulfobacterales bacterium]
MDETIQRACEVRETQDSILMVDDNATNLQVLSQTLAGRGYRLLVAKNGESALAITNKAQPDLILLDIMMPGMDGFEVCRQLKADPETHDIPIIFLSALGQTEDKVRGLQLGAVDYITKPFQPEEVIARVETHLTLRCLQRRLEAANFELRDLNENLEQKVKARTRELEAEQAKVLKAQNAIIFGMAKLTESRDDDTGKHLERIERYVEILARELAKTDPAISEQWIEHVKATSALHDIGKVGIPDAVLQKPGRLTPEERRVIELHPEIGGDTIGKVRERLGTADHELKATEYLRRAMEITYGHHEKWDGSGYPYGTEGEGIPLSARLVAVADVYDALVSKRVYKSGMTHQEAGDIIRAGAGQHFDPRVVAAFNATEDRFRQVADAYSDVPD